MILRSAGTVVCRRISSSGVWGCCSPLPFHRHFERAEEDRNLSTVVASADSSASPSQSALSAAADYSRIPPDIEGLVREYARKPQTAASLQSLMKTGRGEVAGKSYKSEAFLGRMGRRLATERILLHVASFLRKELPIRLANQIVGLDRVPMMKEMESVRAVKGIYIQSFLEMINFQPNIRTPQDEVAFATMLEALYLKHSGVLVQMARGASELREELRSGAYHRSKLNTASTVPSLSFGSFETMKDCHSFLDRFYTSRIGIRVLAGQYLSLRGEPRKDYVGMICQTTSPSEVVLRATEDAARMCVRRYGDAPKVKLDGRLDLTFPYIPTYLHYILLELLKNALRATAEKHADRGKGRLPPVEVIVADGADNEDVVIKISDEGGGIRRSHMKKIWSYLFTTADPSVQEAFLGGAALEGKDHGSDSPIAGLGYGLPISRSYCRYFGGDLDIMSMEGYGTDAFVHLKRIGDTKEPVPVY